MSEFSRVSADQLCQGILKLDDAILAVALCNFEGKIRGTVLRKDRAPWKDHSLDAKELANLAELLGPRVSVVLGVADQSTSILGQLECVVASYSSYHVLVKEIPQADMNAALMLDRACDLGTLQAKVGTYLRENYADGMDKMNRE